MGYALEIETAALKIEGTVSPEEYLKFERNSEEKHELIYGEIIAMTGASRKHNIILGNLFSILHRALKGRHCRVYMNDLRVRIKSMDLYTYPDIVITCGEEDFEDSHKDTLQNPKCIIEILSDSTEKYDRGEKFNHYRKIESLEEYILVSQDFHTVESFIKKNENSWLFSAQEGLDRFFEIRTCDMKISLQDIYDASDD